MIIDNHVHVGWFSDGYHTPKDVWNSVVAAGIDGMAVASTSTCAELYKDVCREMRELVRLGGERVHPILWLTPKMLKWRYPLPFMLHGKIEWQGLKIHPEAHPEWVRNPMLMEKAVTLARRMDVPLLIHTGQKTISHAGLFAGLVKRNSDVTFVLAHGRPRDETLAVLCDCDNVFVDMAFMPMADVKSLAGAGFSHRMLFGTDMPINEVFYKDICSTEYVRSIIYEVRRALGDDADRVLSRCVYRKNALTRTGYKFLFREGKYNCLTKK